MLELESEFDVFAEAYDGGGLIVTVACGDAIEGDVRHVGKHPSICPTLLLVIPLINLGAFY